jgi:ArsR family transcriptional regulator
MSKSNAEEKLQAKAGLLKALGHPVRLLILNLIRAKPRHGEELATILRLNPATVSHHLAKLAEAGLVRSRKTQYYQTYSLVGNLLDRTLGEIVLLPLPKLSARVEEDAYRDKVMRAFFRSGRLVRIPAQLKKRQIIFQRLVQEFEPDQDYPEREVNQILVEYHDDVATLRRGLIEHHLMERKRGIFRRLPDKREA